MSLSSNSVIGRKRSSANQVLQQRDRSFENRLNEEANDLALTDIRLATIVVNKKLVAKAFQPSPSSKIVKISVFLEKVCSEYMYIHYIENKSHNWTRKSRKK